MKNTTVAVPRNIPFIVDEKKLDAFLEKSKDKTSINMLLKRAERLQKNKLNK